jgi:PhnB protein
MSQKIDPIPTDRPRLGPYITVHDGAAALDFYGRAFGAIETSRLAEPGGRIGHAEVRIGESVLMLSDEFEEYGARSPRTLGGSPVMLHLYVEDADAVVAAAEAAGATVDQPVEDQFYGDRGGKITDPFGHRWWIAMRVEEVSDEETRRRATALYGMS